MGEWSVRSRFVVLMCWDKNNIGWVKSIVNNGGGLENEEDGHITLRYGLML